MGVSYSKATIDGGFQRIMSLQEVRLDYNITSFLENSYASFNAKSATNPQGPFRRSLLHYAAMGDCTKIVCILLQNGAAVDCRDQNRRTPLHWAAEYGALDCVKILLKNGAELNAKDDMGSTPLEALLHAGTGQTAKTEAYLRKCAKETDAKRRK